MNHHIAYGSITLYSPREQETWMFAGEHMMLSRFGSMGQLLHDPCHVIAEGLAIITDIFPCHTEAGEKCSC